MEPVLLSIIVPVYNTEQYLERCVDSLRKQTYTHIEILLIDDGSTDGSGLLCDRLAMTDRRIRVYHKNNGGSSSARNVGLSIAKGTYIGFVDSDDFIEYNMYELLYRGVEQNRVTVAQVGRDELDADGRRLPDICEPPGKPQLLGDREFLEELLLHRGDCSFCTKLFHRSLFEPKDARFPEGVLNEDFHLLVQLLPRIGAILSLPEQAYHVFCRPGSNTRRQDGSFSRVFLDNVDNADMAAEIVEERYPGVDYLRQAAFRFGVVQRLDYMLHVPIGQMNKKEESYRIIVRYLRKNWWRAMKSPLLSVRNKWYHTLFAAAPATVRRIHRKKMELADRQKCASAGAVQATEGPEE